MKRALVLTLALMLLVTAASAANLSESGFPVVVGEPATLTLLKAEDTLVTDFEVNAFTQYVEENCNVNLDFTLLPASDAASKLQLMISSGETLPDVIAHNLSTSTVYTYAQAGALIPVDTYYQNHSIHFKRAVETYPEYLLLEQITCPDGQIYSIPSYFRELNNNYRFRYWINTAWLETLGLEMPETTDAFYEALKAFKENDPNGNGLQDEIPLRGAWVSDSSTYNLVTFVMNAFVQTAPNADYLYLEEGQVQAAYATEGWRDGLAYLRKLCAEELMDPASFTQTSSQALATLANPEACIVGVYAVQGAKDSYIEQFDALMPLEGPTGLRQATYSPTKASNVWMITADCDNPELAYRVGDFMFTDEAFLLCRVGEKGVSWVPAGADDVSIYGSENPCTFVWLDNGAMWFNAQNATWRQIAPVFGEIGLDGQAVAEDLTMATVKSAASVLNLHDYSPASDSVIVFLTYTEDEAFAINDIAATIKSYAMESMVRFITGDMNIETEWDAYMAELENIGLSTYLQTAQAAHDRQ